MAFAGITMLHTTARSSSLDEHFKSAINTTIQHVKETPNAADKREMLGKFLVKMDKGLGMAQSLLPNSEGKTLSALQLKIKADYADLNGNGTVKVADADLNKFANYVQQDAEQADQVLYISAGGLIIILIILLILL